MTKKRFLGHDIKIESEKVEKRKKKKEVLANWGLLGWMRSNTNKMNVASPKDCSQLWTLHICFLNIKIVTFFGTWYQDRKVKKLKKKRKSAFEIFLNPFSSNRKQQTNRQTDGQIDRQTDRQSPTDRNQQTDSHQSYLIKKVKTNGWIDR